MIDEGSGFIFGALLAGIIASIITYNVTHNNIMSNAFEKGKAVQCLGKDGYHFTCEDKK